MARPAVFANLGFEAAVARSRTNRSVLIIDAMAAWCGPCRQMDRTTWVDTAVVARLTGDGTSFAIQIDVDAEPAIAAQLDVQAMPTLIAFVAGVEHDRLVGGRGPDDLIEWLDIVERGARAATLLAATNYGEALIDYLWLWTRARDASLVDEMTRLAAAHAPARIAFAELRDAAPTQRIEDVFAWITLNQIIGDADAIVRWYDANVAELPPSRAVAQLVELAVLPLLIERARWSDAGAALADPTATFQRLAKARSALDLRAAAANLVRALYAAGRDERASDLEFEARSTDPSPEMSAALATATSSGRDDRARSRAKSD